MMNCSRLASSVRCAALWLSCLFALNILSLTVQGGTLTLEVAETTILTGVIQDGAGTLTILKTGPGKLRLEGVNTYSGGTFIEEGAISVSNAAALGTGIVEMALGTSLLFEEAVTIATNTFTLNGLLSTIIADYGSETVQSPDSTHIGSIVASDGIIVSSPTSINVDLAPGFYIPYGSRYYYTLMQGGPSNSGLNSLNLSVECPQSYECELIFSDNNLLLGAYRAYDTNPLSGDKSLAGVFGNRIRPCLNEHQGKAPANKICVGDLQFSTGQYHQKQAPKKATQASVLTPESSRIRGIFQSYVTSRASRYQTWCLCLDRNDEDQ